MAYSVARLPIQFGRETDVIAFGLRAVTADFVRGIFRKRFDAGAVAGVSRPDVAQRFSLSWGQARANYKNVRDVPSALIQWAGFAEFHAADTDYPTPEDKSIGTFNRDVLTVLPGGVVLIQLGGIKATGLIEEGAIRLHEVSEVRIREIEVGYEAVIVMGRPERDASGEEQPLPTEHEPLPA